MWSDQRRVLVGLAEPRGEGHRRAERVARLLRQRAEQRRVEEAGRDRHDADAPARHVARRRQRHPDDAALRRRIGDLADLAVERRDRRGVDADAALAAGVGLVRVHRRGGEAQHVEGADQVDLDDVREELEVVRPVLRRGALRPADARAADRDPQAAAGLGGGVDGGRDLLGLGHVTSTKRARVAELGDERLALLRVQVGDHHRRAARVQRADRRRAQARRRRRRRGLMLRRSPSDAESSRSRLPRAAG